MPPQWRDPRICLWVPHVRQLHRLTWEYPRKQTNPTSSSPPTSTPSSPPPPPPNPSEQDTRILAPGACDNAAGLTALLALAAALHHAQLTPAVPILFAANVGEEGEGNLRGMRHLFDPASPEASTTSPPPSPSKAPAPPPSSPRPSPAAASASPSPAPAAMPGPTPAHPTPSSSSPAPSSPSNPSRPQTSAHPRTTLNIGLISGGTSINSIPASATALLDLRSTSPAALDAAELTLRQTLNQPNFTLDLIGDRPGGALPDDSPLLATLRAVDRHLNLRTEPCLGSTDANIPLSLGIPAIAIGAGGIGGGIHTLNEWYDPTGRTLALRRILLTLLDTAHLAAHQP